MTDDDPIWTHDELVAFARGDVRGWALERLHLQDSEAAARLGRPRREAPPPGPDDPEIDRLAAAREELRARGKALLANDDTRAIALFALERQRDRWAASLILDELDSIRRTDEFSLVWEVLANLGDLRALDAGLLLHRPGERRLARPLAFLHQLAGRSAPLPAAVVADAGMPGPVYGLRVPLRCLGCRNCGEYDVESAVIHPDIPKCRREGWDGTLFSRIISCKWCGAEDEYELTALAKVTLVLAREDHERARTSGRPDERGVVVGEARLWDGTQCRRPTQSLAHLRAIAAGDPKRGEGWRRVGNFCERIGRMDDARAAWEEAARADPGELEAVFSIAKDHDEHDRHELASRGIDDFFKRFAANPERRAGARGAVVAILEMVRRGLPPRKVGLYAMWEDGHAPDGGPILRQSGLDLASVASVETLADFLIRPSVIGAGLAKDVPRDRPTQLEIALGALHGALPASAIPVNRATAKVGRNEPCPCGSGKKHKRCCGGLRLLCPLLRAAGEPRRCAIVRPR